MPSVLPCRLRPFRAQPALACAAACALVLLAACAPAEPTDPVFDLATLAIDPDSFYVVQAQSYEVRPVGRTAEGIVVRPRAVWHGGGGSVDASDVFTAGIIPGIYSLKARTDGLTAEATVFVDYYVIEIVVTPSTVTLQPGGTQQFVARGVDVIGDTIPIRVVWNATGGSITPGGLFTAGNAGAPQITAELVRPVLDEIPADLVPRRAVPVAGPG